MPCLCITCDSRLVKLVLAMHTSRLLDVHLYRAPLFLLMAESWTWIYHVAVRCPLNSGRMIGVWGLHFAGFNDEVRREDLFVLLCSSHALTWVRCLKHAVLPF
jgi:hypothetical protein